jgi:predicted transcriptional regulator
MSCWARGRPRRFSATFDDYTRNIVPSDSLDNRLDRLGGAFQEDKMSEFTESVIKDFARRQNQPVLLRKGEYHLMVAHVVPGDIPAEVTEKLDRIAAVFQGIAEMG